MTDDQHRLLVIDDDETFLRLVRKIATHVGYETQTTLDPAVFKTLVVDWDPHVTMTDLKMPQFDGIEVINFLAEIGSKSKLILASGWDNHVLETARRIAAEQKLVVADMLEKPIRAKQLSAALRKHLPAEEILLTSDRLLQAIEDDEFVLHYQPILDIATRTTIGHEALIRWEHPQRGLLYPGTFIPFAEQEGLITEVTKWVARRAIHDCADRRKRGANGYFSINVSGRDAHQIDLADTLAALCSEYDVPAESIHLELTETAAMEDPIGMMVMFARLRLRGHSLLLDDFGTGYSSLVQLHQMPFTTVKIDRSFVRDLGDSPDSNHIIVKSICDLGHNLGMKVLAEGVETAICLERLTELKCDQAQGYLIGRPTVYLN